MSVKTITDNLKNKSFCSLYYIFGQEEYLKNYYYNELKQKAVTDMPEFNTVEFDNKSFDWLDFCNCVNSYPVMAERKFVGVINFDNSRLKGNFTKQFVEFLKSIPDFCTVVFLDNELKSITSSNPLEKAIASADGVVASVPKPSPSSLVSWTARHFKQASKQISAEDINYMLSIADTDMRALLAEISKLCSYVHGDTVTRADIDTIVTKSIEANRFEIGDAFCAKNYDKVLDILDKMYKQNIDDILIVNVFYRAFADMYKIKLAMSCGKPYAEAARDFSLNPYGAGKIAKNANSVSLEFLETAIGLSKQLDIKLKSTSYNKRDLITFYVADLINRRNAVAKA